MWNIYACGVCDSRARLGCRDCCFFFNAMKTKATFLAFLSIIGFFSNVAFSQPFCRVRTFSTYDGLPSNNISTVAQDNNDLVWVSTWNGLCFFDGYEFTTFRGGDELGWLTSNRIGNIKPDGNGCVWLLTYDRRPYYLDTKRGKFNSLGERIAKISGNSFYGESIYVTSSGTWITGSGNLVAVKVAVERKEDGTVEHLTPVKRSDLRNGATRIYSIKEDSFGNEWLITDAGVELFGSDITCRGNLMRIREVGGTMFFADAEGRYHSYRNGKDSLISSLPKIPIAGKANALQGYDDRALLAATDAGIAVYDMRSGRWHMIADSNGSNRVTAIYVDSHDRIWGFTNDGGVLITDMSGTLVSRLEQPSEIEQPTRSLLNIWVEDRHGTVWLAPKGGVFSYYDEETRRIVPYRLVSPNLKYTAIPLIERFFIDRSSNLWLSSSRDLTLVNFSRPNIKASPLAGNYETRSLLVHADGSIWAGSSNGVLAKYSPAGDMLGYFHRVDNGKGGMRIALSQSPVTFSDKIYCMARDRNGLIWIGTKGNGVYTVDESGKVVNYRHKRGVASSLPCDSIYAFDEDDRGNMWIASYGGGLLRARQTADGGYEFEHAGYGLTGYPIDRFNRIRRIMHTTDGVVILSCTDGLVTFSNRFSNPGEIKFYSTCHEPGNPSSLRTNNVMQTFQTSSGKIFVITMGGDIQTCTSDNLLRDGLEFTRAGSDQDVFNRMSSSGNALSIIEGGRGNLYVVRETTIEMITSSTGAVNMFGPADLGETVEFTEAAPIYDSESGRLWFGVLGGVVSFSHDDIVKSEKTPNIVFTGVQYQGKVEKEKLLAPENLEIHGDNRHFSVSFAALDYYDSHTVQYAYRLEQDKDWTYIGNAHTVQFANLSPGVHRLYVKSSNGDGYWFDNEKHLDIIVYPGFWESFWGHLLKVAIVLLVLASVAYFYFLRRKNQLDREFHQKEHEFFINASHRLRTPLTLIGSPVTEVLNTEKNLSTTGRFHLEKVQRNAQNMLEMVNAMLKGRSNGEEYITDETASMAADYDAGSMATEAGDESTEVIPAGNYTPLNAVDEAINTELPVENVEEKVKILVVEDNDDLRSYLCDILSAQYMVVSASNGKIGLEKAESEQPDFILTDVTMPEMDGLTMVKNIKRNKRLSHIPIVVLSAKASVRDKVEGLREGIDDYITKPFSATYLRHRIASIITQRRVWQQEIMENIGKELQAGLKNAANENLAGSGEAAAITANDVDGGSPGDSRAKTEPVGSATGNIEAEMIDGQGENLSPVSTATNSDSVNAGDEQEPVKREYRLSSPQIADADQEMMAKLLKFMETRISDEDLKIEELAEAVNMGRTVFYGKIKALVGMSPSDFLRRLRMQRAEELIAKSKMNFSQIAFNVGFSDPKYFTKCFKRETGMTPSEYRQKSLQQPQ